jgi:enediyne biosynthesis protein E4
MGFLERLGLLVILSGVLPAQQPAKSTEGPQPRPAFMDVTSALGVDFQYMASHTPRHYFPQTMGAEVALFDYDNDGRLDLFLVNGAPIKDPATKGTILQKTGPNYWNRLYHQKRDGTFEDVTVRAGLQGAGYRAIGTFWSLP